MALLVWVSCLPAFAATTVTLRPDGTGAANGDAFVTTGPGGIYEGVNYGGAGALAVSAPSAKGTFETLIRIDVSAAASTFDGAFGAGMWQVDSVSLELSAIEPNNPLFNGPNAAGKFSISWFADDNWIEGSGGTNSATTTGVSWSDVAALTSGAESQGVFDFTGTGLAQYAMNPSPGLLADILSGGLVSLHVQPADSAISASFGSRANFPNRPALIITASAVPEPGRMGLSFMVLMAFVSHRRRSQGTGGG